MRIQIQKYIFIVVLRIDYKYTVTEHEQGKCKLLIIYGCCYNKELFTLVIYLNKMCIMLCLNTDYFPIYLSKQLSDI